MKRVPMVALRSMRYGTRRLRAGDPFDATRGEATVFQAVGLAADAPRQTVTTRTVKPAELQTFEVDLAPLRAEYEALTGRKPHHLWRAPRLAIEIEAAKAAAAAAPTIDSQHDFG